MELVSLVADGIPFRVCIPTKHYPLLFTNGLYEEHLQRYFRQREAPPSGVRAALGTASLAPKRAVDKRRS